MDTRNAGMQGLLPEISMNKESSSTESLKKMNSLGVKVLSDSVQVWRALTGLTSGVARTVVQSEMNEDGFEAWRRLHHQFEPKLVIKQCQILAEFAAVVMHPADGVTETRSFVTELERKMGLIRELTHEVCPMCIPVLSSLEFWTQCCDSTLPLSRASSSRPPRTEWWKSQMRLGRWDSVTSSKGDPMQIGSLGADHSD